MFYTLAKQQPIYMYHGTSYRNLSKILSEGLSVSPKNKVWETDPYASFNHPSRASLKGIYFTKNLMTGIQSAGNSNKEDRRGDKIIVIAQIMPGSLYADEDAISLAPVRFPDCLPNERMSSYLYIYNQYSHLLGDWDRDNLKSDWERSKELYVNACLERIKGDLVSEIKVHPELEKRLKELLSDGFAVALHRQMSHVDDYTWRSALDTLTGRKEGAEDAMKPEISLAEEEYKKYQDKLSRVLRVLALSEIGRGEGLRSGMVREKIGFSGGNKIVAIVRLSRSENWSYKVEVVWQGEDGIPEEAKRDFNQQYQQNISSDWEGLS